MTSSMPDQTPTPLQAANHASNHAPVRNSVGSDDTSVPGSLRDYTKAHPPIEHWVSDVRYLTPAALTRLDEQVVQDLGVWTNCQTPSMLMFSDYAGLALRDNPKRAQLIVSRLLGKHIPVSPAIVSQAGHTLGKRILRNLTFSGDELENPVVVGYCETATALGHLVAESLNAPYIHTTRRPHPLLPVAYRFDEPHSHAVAHLIQPTVKFTFDAYDTVVLVDDELTTGTTVLNTIAELHEVRPRRLYVVATLFDARTRDMQVAFDNRMLAMGVNIIVAAAFTGTVTMPSNILEKVPGFLNELPSGAGVPDAAPGAVRVYEDAWMPGVPSTARHGVLQTTTRAMRTAGKYAAEQIVSELAGGTTSDVLVVGTEELMFAPLAVAEALEGLLPDGVVVFQTTTRSPVHPSNTLGYAIRRSLSFAAPDDPTRLSRIHNLLDPAWDTPGWEQVRYTDVVVVVDTSVDAAEPLIQTLAPFADLIHVLLLPATESVPL